MTQCIAPSEIQDGDLLAYLDGQASVLVREHLARCAACRTDAADLASLERELAAALFRAACPPTQDLLMFQVHLLGRSEAAPIRLHVQGCVHCQAELAELAAVPLFSTAQPLSDRLRDAGKRLFSAVLIPPVGQPALQRRGTEQASQIYQAGLFQVLLAKVPPVVAENIWHIEGQILGTEETGNLADLLGPADVQISLLRDDPLAALVAQDTVDDLGFFLLEGVAAGAYVLQIETPDAIVRLEDFKIP